MQHSKLVDSFSNQDEHFFGSYEAERVSAEGSLTIEFDSLEPNPPSPEQAAHFDRFRRPVAGILAAMGALSLVALGQHGFQRNSRGNVVGHVASTTAAIPATAEAEAFSSASAVAGRTIPASAVERTSEGSSSWTELTESAVAFVFDEPTKSRASGSQQPSLADSTNLAMQASSVNEFTSELLSMCRCAPA